MEASNDDHLLRVCTWNVLRTDRERRREILTESLRRINPGVICLQETSLAHSGMLAEELGMHLGYAGGASQREDGDIGVAVLSKLPFSRTQEFQLAPAAHESLESRSVMLAAVQIGGTERIFGSVHLSHTKLAGSLALLRAYRETVGASELLGPGKAESAGPGVSASTAAMSTVRVRLAQLGELLGFLAEFRQPGQRGTASNTGATSTLIAGDFNAPPEGPEYRAMLSAGFRDSWRAGPRLGSGATIVAANPFLARESMDYDALAETTIPGATGPWDYCLDYQFIDGDLRPGAAWTVGHGGPGHAWPSDHLGIVVDYSW